MNCKNFRIDVLTTLYCCVLEWGKHFQLGGSLHWRCLKKGHGWPCELGSLIYCSLRQCTAAWRGVSATALVLSTLYWYEANTHWSFVRVETFLRELAPCDAESGKEINLNVLMLVCIRAAVLGDPTVQEHGCSHVHLIFHHLPWAVPTLPGAAFLGPNIYRAVPSH